MKTRRARTLQALVLALTGFFLLEKIWSGTIFLYINQRFMVLVALAGVALVIMAQIVFQARPPTSQTDDPSDTDEITENAKPEKPTSPAWIAIPLLLSLLIPARPLGASSLSNRGISVSSPFMVQSSGAQILAEQPPVQRTVLEWIRTFSATADPSALAGEPVDVIGFVYHDPRLPAGQFLVARFTISCCIADAAAIGLTVAWDGAQALTANQWVRVQGEMATSQLDGQTVPLIRADQVSIIPEPAQPYLFP
jgi:putative membrane protein